jgi:SAM-dependent methyltransferase
MAPGGTGDAEVAAGNVGQAEHWSADEANHWVIEEKRYSGQLAPFGELVLEAAELLPADDILDIGCGCGDTTLAAARTANDGTALGVDISEPMLARARERAREEGVTNARFEQGDGQVHPFQAAGADVALSRFGLMFFEDAQAAFANIARALRPSGRLSFVCWQALEANEWLMVPGLAVAAHIPLPDLGEPGAPGMFALADRDRVAAMLTSAGFVDIGIDSAEPSMLIGGGGTLDEAVTFMREGGIGKALLAEADPAVVPAALDAVRDSLEPYVTPRGVELGSAVWIVRARRQ